VVRELTQNRLGSASGVEVMPLYGNLPKSQQDLVLLPSKHSSTKQRVIVSSPIAEASLTIQGVTCVVDSGLRREAQIDAQTNLPRLVTVRISQDSAMQRAGRAGRTTEGLCHRLYTEQEFKGLERSQSPEIQNCDLMPLVLTCLEWKDRQTTENYKEHNCATEDGKDGNSSSQSAEDICDQFPFITSPPLPSVEKALEILTSIGAVEVPTGPTCNRYRLTTHGKTIAKIPTHPRIATAISQASLTADKNNSNTALVAAITTAALLDDDGMFKSAKDSPNIQAAVEDLLSSGSSSRQSKHLLQYASRITRDSRARDLLTAILTDNNNPDIDDIMSQIGPAMVPGFLDLIAQRKKQDASYGGSLYQLSLDRIARLDDVTNAGEYIVVLETSTGDDDTARIRTYAPLDTETVLELAKPTETLFTVPSRGHEVRARRVWKVGQLELRSEPLELPGGEQVGQILLETLMGEGGIHGVFTKRTTLISIKEYTKIQDLRTRVRLASMYTEEGNQGWSWPSCFGAIDTLEDKSHIAVDTSSHIPQANLEDEKLMHELLVEEAEEILTELLQPYLNTITSLAQLNLLDILSNELLSHHTNYLKGYFPTRIQAPDGSSIPLTYPPTTAAEVATIVVNEQQQPPIIIKASAKLQQFFGTTTSPKIGPPSTPSSQIPVTLSLKSPSGKGVVLGETSDLSHFWNNAYPQIRKDMRGKYPKHPWPEDPTTAIATKLTNKALHATAIGENQKNDDDTANVGNNKKIKRPKKKKKKDKK